VNGKPLESSFQRRTGTRNRENHNFLGDANSDIGYVQQQDLHLETSTVREALRFSAILRQPKSVPAKEKYDHVEEVIKVRVPLSPNKHDIDPTIDA
jgi:ATP-binding cassette, subfamily G (WHITE), member 2, PDR